MADQPSIYEIFCLVYGEDSFKVEIAENKSFSDLKDAIKEKKKPKFDSFAAKELTLYVINLRDDDNLEQKADQLLNPGPAFERLKSTRKLSSVFQGTPAENTLHILVQPLTSAIVKRTRRDNLMPLPKKQKIKVDITRQLVAKWSQPITATNLQTLRAHLQQPLAEEEKIPIPQDHFDRLCVAYSSVPPEYALSAEQLSTLFRVSEDEKAPSALQDKYPAYGLLVKKHCVLRGEEKGSDSDGDPERELVDKLEWTYDSLPYIFGYHATTTDVHYVAITSPPSTIKPLFDHNLKFKEDRVAHLVHLIRLSGVVAWLGRQLPSRNRPEFVTLDRQDGLVQMTIGATVVRKEFRRKDAVDHVHKLVEIYGILKRKKVPNVDTLDSFNIKGNSPHVYLSPVGIDIIPQSGLEAFDAVVCVLQALKVMHSNPDPVYHRDIRQPNIIKRFDGQGWFLIDWSDASTAPTRAVTHLRESEHSPRVRQDNHGAEVDIWSTGKYLEHLASRAICRIASPDAVKQMARRWIADDTTSAASALDDIVAARDLFIAPSVQTLET